MQIRSASRLTGRVLRVSEDGRRLELDLPDGPRWVAASNCRPAVEVVQPKGIPAEPSVEERDVYALWSAGLSYREIGRRTDHSPEVIKRWVERVEDYLGDQRRRRLRA